MIITNRFTLLTLIVVCISIIAWYIFTTIHHQAPIKAGILHSLTGPMAVYEKTAIDATILAIDEINAQGGILGRHIKPFIVDGASNATTFAQQAEKLITQDNVSVIFGCWQSSDRKAVKPIVEKYNNLLFYPVQHEGLEDSPNIVYTSTIPNQQAIPAVTWCFNNLGKRFFIVGTDELFSRATNEIIKNTITTLNGEIAAELLVKSTDDVASIVQKIIETKPSVIINTMFGPINLAFFKQLRSAGITSEKIPTMSLSIDEPELQKYGAEYMTGDYSSWSHFQSIDRIENKQFVTKIKKRYGKDYVVSDAMEAAYFGVYLWKQALEKAHSIEPRDIIPALSNQAYNAPEGIIAVDDASLHTWSLASVGKIRSDKQFTIVWNSNKAVPPRAYPFFKTRDEWNALLDQWYKEWGNKWSNK